MKAGAKNRIVCVPGVLGGKPVVRGTRIPVAFVLNLLSHGDSVEKILEEYPNLVREDVLACIEYAARTVQGEEIVPVARAR